MRRFSISGSGCLTILTFSLLGMILLPRLGGLIGAVVGYAVWAWMNRGSSGRRRSTRENIFRDFERAWEQRRRRVGTEAMDALLGLFMAVVRQNPRGQREIHRQSALQILHQYALRLGIPFSRLSRRFESWSSRRIPVEELSGRVRKVFPQQALVEFLYGMSFVSFADGRLGEDERGMLEYIARRFGLSEAQVERILRTVQRQVQGRRRDRGGRSTSGSSGPSLREAYDRLGLEPDAPLEKVKEKYRELARRYHPDRFNGGEGTGREEAEEKMISINNAYKRILDAEEN